MSVVDRVRNVLVVAVEKMPMSFGSLEKRLSRIECTMYSNSDIVFDHGDYSTVRVCKECTEDEEEECIKYSVTRYRLAWLGIACGEHRVVAVLRNLIAIEEDDMISKVVHYDVINVIENERLFGIVKERKVANAIAKRKLVELLDKLKCGTTMIPRIAAMHLWVDLLRETVK
jgi:hypothetical protein